MTDIRVKARSTNWSHDYPFFPADAPLVYSAKKRLKRPSTSVRGRLKNSFVWYEDDRPVTRWSLKLEGPPDQLVSVMRHWDICQGRFGVFPFVEPVAFVNFGAYELLEDANDDIWTAPSGIANYTPATSGGAYYYLGAGVDSLARVTPSTLTTGHNLLASDIANANGTTLWDPTSSSVLFSSLAHGYMAGQCIEVQTPGSVVDEGIAFRQGASPDISGNVGEYLTASFWVYSDVSATVTPSILWKDSLYADNGTVSGSEVTLVAGAWTRCTVSGLVPASTVYARARVRTSSTAQALSFYVGAAQLESGSIGRAFCEPAYGYDMARDATLGGDVLTYAAASRSPVHRVIMARYFNAQRPLIAAHYNRHSVELELVEVL